MYLGVRGCNLEVGECNLGVREYIWELDGVICELESVYGS